MDFYISLCTKINSILILKLLEITRKTLKLLEKIVKTLQGIGMGKKKFGWVGGITSQKHKADKGDFIKLKSFSIEKGIINRVKRYPIK